MTPAETAVTKAANIRLEFDDDVLVFGYTNADGREWEGCVEEWIGNARGDSKHNPRDHIIEYQGEIYYQLGASGGGADVVLLRAADSTIWYCNDLDLTISLVATGVSEFIALLRAPAD
ncbi:MAG: hypothetical protein K0U86_08695 [Planctomycetes bacterium]|nr:hypothetical protein [Planctomycetota bacterium]MCH9724968.1 hypothetical protein [Planctomycetota bacterium]MCH9777571.1 hypothetical protein [Planctomycetota bacterium]MCH9793463.1 hypothetical protein [Planctomycetota bacterium]